MAKMSNNIILDEKFDRFRSVVYTIVDKDNENEYIQSLRTSKVSDFLAQGQLLISQFNLRSPVEFANCVLGQVGLSETFAGASAENQRAIMQYTAYFYEIIMLLNKSAK